MKEPFPRVSISKSDRKILTSSAGATAIGINVSIFTLLFSIWVINNLPVSSISLYASYMAFANVVGFSLSGFQNSLTKNKIMNVETTKRSPDIDKNPELRLLTLSCLMGLLLVLISPFWNSVIGITFPVLIVICITPLASALFIIIGARLAAVGKFLTYSIFSLIAVLLNFLIQFTFSRFLIPSVFQVVGLIVGLNLLLGFIGLKILNKLKINKGNLFNSNSVRIAIFSMILGCSIHFDVLTMGLFLSPIDRASYALIGTLTKSVVYLLGFLNAAIFTIALQRKRDLKGVKDILTITVMVMIIILIFAVVVTFLWGDEIVVLVYGDHEILTSRFMFELLVASIPIILTSVISPFFMLNPDWSLIGVMSFSLITFCLLGFTWINSIENLILNNFLMGISLVLIYLGKYLRKKISIFELGTSVDKD
jgi:hypothetical protein